MFKYTHHKPDPLKLLAILVTMAVLMTSAVDAAEPFYESLNLADLADGELMITPLGRQGAGIHMSYQGDPNQHITVNSTSLNNHPTSSTPAVFLAVRVPW
jgi:hypothetical protein